MKFPLKIEHQNFSSLPSGQRFLFCDSSLHIRFSCNEENTQEGATFPCMFDTGTYYSVISESNYKKIPDEVSKIGGPPVKLESIGGVIESCPTYFLEVGLPDENYWSMTSKFIVGGDYGFVLIGLGLISSGKLKMKKNRGIWTI